MVCVLQHICHFDGLSVGKIAADGPTIPVQSSMEQIYRESAVAEG
jgi:hypothetical protein